MAGSRQPIDLIIYKGKKHLTKEEIEQRRATEIKARSDEIAPPSYLPKKLQNEFNRIAEQLTEIGIMTNLDCEALAHFVVAEYQWQKISKQILKCKEFDESYFELVRAQERIFKIARQAANDLGLTISSRCKLVLPKPKEEEKPPSKWEKFMG